MYLCLSLHIYICKYIYIYIGIYICVCVCRVRICACVRVCGCVCVCVCAYVRVRARMSKCLYLYTSASLFCDIWPNTKSNVCILSVFYVYILWRLLGVTYPWHVRLVISSNILSDMLSTTSVAGRGSAENTPFASLLGGRNPLCRGFYNIQAPWLHAAWGVWWGPSSDASFLQGQNLLEHRQFKRQAGGLGGTLRWHTQMVRARV